jgi:D-glycero-D-manno-heptose 1,7-bisphosphate phosphatase
MVDIYWGGHEVSDINTSEYVPSRCVIGLDRDGVINEDRGTYTWLKEDFKPISGSLDAIKRLRRKGFGIVVITNQAGITKGLYTPEQVDKLHEYMLELLGQAGCPSIDGIYYSTTNLKEDIYAKPNTGMFERAEKELKNKKIKFNQGYYVGDKLSDLKAAMKIGAKPILVRTGHGLETETLINKRFTYKKIKKATKVFDNLAAFADWIEKRN